MNSLIDKSIAKELRRRIRIQEDILKQIDETLGKMSMPISRMEAEQVYVLVGGKKTNYNQAQNFLLALYRDLNNLLEFVEDTHHAE